MSSPKKNQVDGNTLRISYQKFHSPSQSCLRGLFEKSKFIGATLWVFEFCFHLSLKLLMAANTQRCFGKIFIACWRYFGLTNGEVHWINPKLATIGWCLRNSWTDTIDDVVSSAVSGSLQWMLTPSRNGRTLIKFLRFQLRTNILQLPQR